MNYYNVSDGLDEWSTYLVRGACGILMGKFPVADDAPEGDVWRQDCLLPMRGDINAFNASHARATIAADEGARLHRPIPANDTVLRCMN